MMIEKRQVADQWDDCQKFAAILAWPFEVEALPFLCFEPPTATPLCSFFAQIILSRSNQPN